MKFRFQNIRAISDARLELGGLTVIAGRNNTGKTYLAYTLYGFLKEWRNLRQLRFGPDEFVKEIPDADTNAEPFDPRRIAKAVLQHGEARRRVDRATLASERKRLTNTLAQDFSRSTLASVFSSSRSEFAGAQLSVEFEDSFPALVEPREFALPGGNGFSIAYDGTHMVVRGAFSRSPGPSVRRYLRSFLPVAYLEFLMLEIPRPFILSAERFGIALFHKDLDFRKNQLVDLLQKLKHESEERRVSPFLLIERTTSRYALPIKDNIDYTRSVADIRKETSEIQDKKLFNGIREMMDGYYRVSDGEIRFVSRRRGESKFDIPLHLASSSVRGLSDLFFFLRHQAKMDHLLIVDEPESHLDTGNQILLARLLTRIVNSGVRVLITTHSDYLVKEINNLLMLGVLPRNSDVVRSMKYSAEEPLQLDMVKAYIAENGGLTRCKVDKYGIDMPMFDETIESINRVSIAFSSRIGSMD